MLGTHGQVDWLQPVNWNSPLNSGLVSWWLSGDGPYWGGPLFRDLCQRNHGTLTGGPTWTGALCRPGGYGCLSLSGTDQYVLCGGRPSSYGITAGATIGCWFRTASSGFAQLIGIGNGVSVGNSAFAIRIFNGQLNNLAVKDDGSTNVNPNPANTINDSVWHWTALSFDTANVYTWLDGVLVNTTAASWSALNDPDIPLTIGSTSTVNADLAGQIDGGFVYKRALSASEIVAKYLDERQGYPTTLNWSRPMVGMDQGGAAATAFPWHYYQQMMAG